MLARGADEWSAYQGTRSAFLFAQGQGSSTPQGTTHSRFSRAALWSSGCADTVDSLMGGFRSSLLRVTPACICPFPTLQVRPRGAPSHGSGSGWSLLLSCMTLSFHYFTPVYPDAIQRAALHHGEVLQTKNVQHTIGGDGDVLVAVDCKRDGVSADGSAGLKIP
jgi:hypothetical protein